MQNVIIGRYKAGSQRPNHVWDGWIEPKDRSWILFIAAKGPPSLFFHRDLGDEEKKERGFDPGVTGEYVPAEDWDHDEPPSPNLPHPAEE